MVVVEAGAGAGDFGGGWQRAGLHAAVKELQAAPLWTGGNVRCFQFKPSVEFPSCSRRLVYISSSFPLFFLMTIRQTVMFSEKGRLTLFDCRALRVGTRSWD